MNTGTKINWADVHQRLAASEQAMNAALHPDAQTRQRAFDQRAERLARRLIGHVDGGDVISVLAFRVAETCYAIPVEHIAEIGVLRWCQTVPGGASELHGVISHQGRIRSVLDLERMLGRTSASPAQVGYFIQLRANGRETCLRVDALDQIVDLPQEGIAPLAQEDADPAEECIRGIGMDRMVVLRAEALCARAQAAGTASEVGQAAAAVCDKTGLEGCEDNTCA